MREALPYTVGEEEVATGPRDDDKQSCPECGEDMPCCSDACREMNARADADDRRGVE